MMDEWTELKYLFKDLHMDLKEWDEENKNNFADCHRKLHEITTRVGDSKEREIEQQQDTDGDIQEQKNGHEFDELNTSTISNEKEDLKIIKLIYQEEEGWFAEGYNGYDYDDDDDLSTSNNGNSLDLLFEDRQNKRGFDTQPDQFKNNNYLTRKRVRKKEKGKRIFLKRLDIWRNDD